MSSMENRDERAPAVTWIAEEPVVFVHPNGTRAPGRIALAAPIFNEQHRHASCAFDLTGMDAHWTGRATPQMIHGETTLQALLLAASFVGSMLHAFIERGGRVLYPPQPSARRDGDGGDGGRDGGNGGRNGDAGDGDGDGDGGDDRGDATDIDVALDAIFGPLLAPSGKSDTR